MREFRSGPMFGLSRTYAAWCSECGWCTLAEPGYVEWIRHSCEPEPSLPSVTTPAESLGSAHFTIGVKGI
jgi:hypothetical protein